MIRPAWTVPALALLAGACARGPEPGDLAGWNVLLVTVDTLRRDHTGFSGAEGCETPAMDALAGSGVVFEGAVSAAPLTLPSHATLLTGRYPPDHGALDNGFYSLPEDVPTLATILQEHGYRTAAIVGAFVLQRQYGLSRGFDVYDDRFRQPRLPGQLEQERSADEVTGRARAWLRAIPRDRPFFLWIHYFDPHAPYAPPEPWRSRFAGREYDGEITYTDQALGTLLDALRDSGLGERTLVALVADHGEALGDGGETTHGLLLRSGTLRVPLVLSAPGALPAGRRVEGTVSTADLAPTVLALLGLPAPAGADGTDLLGAIRAGRATGRRAYSETRLPADMYGWSMLAGARDDRWAWVRAPRPELYDLRSDPNETRNLAGAGADAAPGATGAEAKALDAFTGKVLARSRTDGGRSVLSEDEMAKLAALGYAFPSRPAVETGADPKDRLELWRRLEEAQSRFGAGDAAGALAEVNGIVQADSTNREALLLRGRALVAAGRKGEGVHALRSLLAEGLAGREAGMVAESLAEAGETAEAESLYQALIRTDAQLPDHAFNLGNLLLGEGRPAEAAEAYRIALKRNPDAVATLVNLAQALALAHGAAAADEVVALMDRAVLLSPEDDRTRLEKIGLCLRVGRRDEARKEAQTLAGKRSLRGVTDAEVAEALRRTG